MPIDIDNTDVSDITIDGQNVSQVTADGNVVWNAIPDSGVSYFPGDGSGNTYTDVWGSNDGTINGPSWNSTTPLSEGNSLEFQESSDENVNLGDVSDSLFNNNGDFTFTVWVRSNNDFGTGGFGDVIISEGSGFNTSGGLTFYVDDTDGLRLGVDNGSIDIAEFVAFPTGQFYFLTLRRTGDTFDVKRGQVNSSLSDVMSTTNSVTVGSSEDFCIGLNLIRQENNESWNDLIYAPRFYSSSLSDSRLDDIRTGNE